MNDPYISDLPALLSNLAAPTSREAYAESEAKLQANYREPGFFARLQEVAADRSMNRDVRFLSSLIVAREVPKKWRAKAIIPDDVKPVMRQNFFRFFDEPDLPIARSQLRLLVTLARIDYPRAWPTLLADLSGPLQSSFLYVSNSNPTTDVDERNRQKTILLNSLWAWNAFVKEWRSVKVPTGLKLMMDLFNDVRGPMNTYLDALMAREIVLDDWELMESARYAFKIGARLVEWEFSRPAKARLSTDGGSIRTFMTNSLQHLSHLQQIRLQLLQSPYFNPLPGHPTPGAMKTLQSVTKFIRAIGKAYVSLLHIDPKGFSDVPGSVNAVGWWWGEVGNAVRSGEIPKEEEVTARYTKGFLLLGLTLFKNILSVLSTEHTDIFNDAFVRDAFNLIVDHLLPMTEADWQAWQDDPEEWFVSEADTGTGWSYEFRPSAERVLIALTSAARNHNIMVPLITQKLQEVMATTGPSDMPARIRQDAILCAVGRMARVLSNSVQLEQILQPLMPAVGSNVPEDRMLKRRIAWLIGQWVSCHEESAKLPIVWQILLHLLAERGEATDIAVNLTAVISINQCTDLWELDIEYFKPFIGQMVEEMLKLMGEADTLAGKRHILDTLTVVIERIKAEILPYLPTLSQAIPALWQSSAGLDGEWLFKASLVTLTAKLVSAIGPGTSNILPLVIPLIEESLQGSAKEHFEEDGLALWQASLRNVNSLDTPTVESGLLKLVPFLVNLLGQNLDLQPQALALMDSYILLDGTRLMHAYGPQITEAFKLALGLAERQAIKAVLASIDLLVRVVPVEILTQTFAATGLMAYLCKEIDNEKSSGSVLAAYLGTLSRMIVVDPHAFLVMVQHVGSTNGLGEHAQVEMTLDAMWRAFDYIAEASLRKLVAMAFASLLTTGSPQIFDRLDGEFVNVFMDVLGEVKETQVDGSMGPELVRYWRDDNVLLWHDIEGTPEGARRESLEGQDIVYSRPLTQYLSEKLGQAQAVGMQPYWQKLDPDVKKQLEKLLT